MALQAQRVPLRPEKFLSFSAVGLVASGAALHKRRLVMHLFLRQVRDVHMATQANLHAIGFRQSRELACVGIVAIRAISRSTGVLHFRSFNLLGFLVVARDAERLRVRLCQHDLPIFCRCMADFALLVCKWWMRKLGQKLWHGGLVRVMALHAVGGAKRLVLMRLLQAFVFGVVAVDAQCRWALGQVVIEFRITRRAGLVGHMASLAAHVQRGVSATLLWHV